MSKQNPLINGQTLQCPKKKDKKPSTKHYTEN